MPDKLIVSDVATVPTVMLPPSPPELMNCVLTTNAPLALLPATVKPPLLAKYTPPLPVLVSAAFCTTVRRGVLALPMPLTAVATKLPAAMSMPRPELMIWPAVAVRLTWLPAFLP